MTLEDCKLAIIATDKISDDIVWSALWNTEIKESAAIDELFGCLQKHRPVLYKKAQQRLVEILRRTFS